MTTRSWIDYLSNDVEVRAILPSGLPLDRLRFAGVSFRPGNILIVEMHTQSMPPDVPEQWVGRGGKFLAVTFRIGVCVATIHMQEVDEMPLVSVFLTDGGFALRVEEETGAAGLQIDAKVFFVEAKLKPMRDAQLCP